MLLSIATNKKSGNITACDVNNAEEAIRELGLKVSTRTLKALRTKCSSETEVVECIINRAYPKNPCLVEYDETSSVIRVYVFNPLFTPVPKVLLGIERGLIQWIMSDSPVETLRLDLDVDLADDDQNNVTWTDIKGNKSVSYASHEYANHKRPGFVRKVFKQVLQQLKTQQ